MTIDLAPPGGGILISGDAEELRDLAQDLLDAIERGTADALILTDEGVESIVVRLEERP